MKLWTVIAVLVAVGLALLAAYPSEVAGTSCYPNTDQNAYTLKRIDCKRNSHAASLHGCKRLCYRTRRCKGIVYATYNWPSGKYCCFLKSKIDEEKWAYQEDRTVCY
eukprot:TRINITY_DN4308_c0_g2_i2.p1 TRINITY_DN4308_c0_g2~~TRINITY_DN4308_c0_g2_i2.p1  ORF type:complete len:107 (-),score=8.23 TRINITY_DN4308_c0_g2_i2:457-777(-)